MGSLLQVVPDFVGNPDHCVFVAAFLLGFVSLLNDVEYKVWSSCVYYLVLWSSTFKSSLYLGILRK